MRNIFILSMILGVLTLESTRAEAQNADRDQYSIKVDGLGCPFCAYGLEKKFKDFKGIKDVNIDIETGIFDFSYPADQPLTMAQVESKVEAAGYTPVYSSIHRVNGDFETTKKAGSENVTIENATEATVMVYGNCGMCAARIEKAAKNVNGVGTAAWSEDSKMLTVSYDASKTSLAKIEKAVAKSGHDTKSETANGKTYEGLPMCCQYERK